MTVANDLAVRRALERAGVDFIDENGDGPGVACGCCTAERGIQPDPVTSAFSAEGSSDRPGPGKPWPNQQGSS
jgi:hypothetical protein